jgi:AcrR family transcriptional regulator
LNRADRAKATRRRVIESAARLFAEEGYAVTTTEHVAREAGVAVQTVYYTFGTKGKLLCDAMEFAAAGTHDPSPVSRRTWMVEALGSESASRSLALAVDHGCDIYQRAAPLWPAVNAAAISDAAVAEYWAGVAAGRRTGMRQLVEHISTLSGLSEGLDVDRATDIMFAMNSHAVFQTLVVESGWKLSTFKGWLYSSLHEQLLADTESDPTALEGLNINVWIDR